MRLLPGYASNPGANRLHPMCKLRIVVSTPAFAAVILIPHLVKDGDQPIGPARKSWVRTIPPKLPISLGKNGGTGYRSVRARGLGPEQVTKGSFSYALPETRCHRVRKGRARTALKTFRVAPRKL